MPTYRSPLWALQNGIDALLRPKLAAWTFDKRDGGGVVAVPVALYDHVPEEPAYPHVTLGEDTSAPWDTKTTGGGEVTVTLHVWTRWEGQRQAKELIDFILSVLPQSLPDLSADGWNVRWARNEFTDVLKDPDGVTRHGVLRYRFLVYKCP